MPLMRRYLEREQVTGMIGFMPFSITLLFSNQLIALAQTFTTYTLENGRLNKKPSYWGGEIHKLHLYRWVRPSKQRVSCIRHLAVWWAGFSPGSLRNAIAPRPTLTRSGSSCEGPIYWSNRAVWPFIWTWTIVSEFNSHWVSCIGLALY